MTLSKTGIKELTARYRSVLSKCFMLNVAVAVGMGMAVPMVAQAAGTPFLATDNQVLSGTYEDYVNSNKRRGGVVAVDYPVTGVTIADGTKFINNTTTISAGGAVKTLNGIGIGNNVEFAGNKSTDPSWGGGALYIQLAKVDVPSSDTNVTIGTSALFDGNEGSIGGAIALEYGHVTVGSGAQFINNIAATKGGAIAVWQDADRPNLFSSLTFNGVLFDNNESLNVGGAIFVDVDAGTVTLNNAIFTDNKATNKGGAIFNEGTVIIGNRSVFENNESYLGGTIYNTGTLTIGNNVEFKDNGLFEKKDVHGSEIFNDGGTVVIGDGLVVSRTSFPLKHDCSLFSSSGSITIGHNATFTNVREVLVVAAGTYSIGNNARFEGVSYGVLNEDGTVTLGDNTSFTNSLGRALQTTTNRSGSITVGDNASFIGGTSAETGSVVFNGDRSPVLNSMTFGTGLTVSGNTSAINATMYNGVNAVMTFNGTADFDGNSAMGNSGVMRNWGTATFKGATTFTNNEATGTNTSIASPGDGGAIVNAGVGSILNFENTVSFSDNKSGGNGGAIMNGAGAVANFGGNAAFSNNIASGVKNDIHNLGTVNITGGTMTLDGGMTGTGALNVSRGAMLDIGVSQSAQGDVFFASGSTLAITLLNSTSYGALTASSIGASGADLSLVVGALGTYDIVIGDGADTFNEYAFAKSSLFSMTKAYDDGTKTLSYTAGFKSADQIAQDTGVTQQTADILAALLHNNNTTAGTILVDIQRELAEGNIDAVNQAASTLAPTTAPVVQSVATNITGQIMRLINGRLGFSIPAGRSGGDTNTTIGPWAQALYSKSKLDKSSVQPGFRGYTQGIAAGIDVGDCETYMLGVGYLYNATDVKTTGRKTNAYGHNFFVYGEYQPDDWFVNGSINYGMSDYKENKNVLGTNVNGKYDVDTWGGQAMVGYDTAVGLTPSVGAQYLHIKQNGYTDTAGQYIRTDNSDLLTAIAGASYAVGFIEDSYTLTPEVRLFATYDIVSDKTDSTVTIGGASYTINGKRLPRFGVDAGAGITVNMSNAVDVSLNYDADIRQNYISHIGSVKVKYSF